MKSSLRIIICLILFYSAAYPQVKHDRKYNAYSGTMVLTVDGGMTAGKTDYITIKPDYMGRVLLEYFLPTSTASSFGIRGFAGGGYIGGQDNTLTPDVFRTKLSFAGGGIVYSLSLKDKVFPYVFAGGSYLWFDPFGDNGVKLPNNQKGLYKKSEVNYIGEIGFRVMLASNLSVNLSGGAQLGPGDYLDDKALGTNNDYLYYANLGFSFSFFADEDSDGDGVPDSKDACPGTAPGIKVDEFGCPLDSDHDGVPDYKDKCPGTPRGVKVDSNGCPLDSDGDGVPDYKDICPNTPKGAVVDDLGCPLDSDGDGVPDIKDKCPDTPYGVQVDSNGCPLDSDHDGVPDYLDKCPDTAPGVQVDSNGCPKVIHKEVPKKEIEKENGHEVESYTLSSSAGFASGSSRLLPSAYAALDNLVKYMHENTLTRWSITGYTDNTGSDRVNKKISLKRAEAVLDYFISKGLSKNRFKVSGKGEADPVSGNLTEAGRAKNRRVEIKRIK